MFQESKFCLPWELLDYTSILSTFPYNPHPIHITINKIVIIDKIHLNKVKGLHPQTNLPTRRPSNNPVLTRMENRHSRDGGDTLAIQLGELVTR